MTRIFTAMPFAVILGSILGIFGVYVTPQVVGLMTSAYDDVFPVLTMKGDLVDRKEDYVDIHIYGRKHRGPECRLVSIYAYTVRPDGLRSDASADRIDRPQVKSVRIEGDWDIGIWRVRPVDEKAKKAEVWTHHNCVGRDVLTNIASVVLA